mmetsp:Transcript_26723/g.43972  ORF Transcript_26723/g.43972 Transcript_26723/m.43972 type:complete len:240 (+) Transcript_26723:1012-1731(+)
MGNTFEATSVVVVGSTAITFAHKSFCVQEILSSLGSRVQDVSNVVDRELFSFLNSRYGSDFFAFSVWSCKPDAVRSARVVHLACDFKQTVSKIGTRPGSVFGRRLQLDRIEPDDHDKLNKFFNVIEDVSDGIRLDRIFKDLFLGLLVILFHLFFLIVLIFPVIVEVVPQRIRMRTLHIRVQVQDPFLDFLGLLEIIAPVRKELWVRCQEMWHRTIVASPRREDHQGPFGQDLEARQSWL